IPPVLASTLCLQCCALSVRAQTEFSRLRRRRLSEFDPLSSLLRRLRGSVCASAERSHSQITHRYNYKGHQAGV
ncbi:hypothetical protein R3P38DRAFT_2857140, partial [Favolaschia claudopus]